MISVLIVLAIVASVAYGFKTKHNVGIIAIAFAYLIGCFGLDIGVNALFRMMPVKLFLTVLSVSLFYNFAAVNKTLEKLSMYLLYRFRSKPAYLPLAFLFITLVMAAMGVGNMPVIAFFTPIMLVICQKAGIDVLIGAMAINYGSLAGTNFMTSVNGVIYRSIMDGAGYDNSFAASTCIFVVTTVIPIIVLPLLSVFLSKKAVGGERDIVEKPEPFDPIQRKNLALIFVMMGIVLVIPFLHLIAPNAAFITFVNSKIDIGFIAIVFTIVALLMKLGSEKEVIARVPWGTLMMICGMGMLISVATEAGTVGILAGWIGGNFSPMLVPIIVTVVAAFMSFFSSTVGVVCPALYPTVPMIAAAAGINPLVLFVAVIVGAQSSAISPFSAAGSIIIGGCSSDETIYNKLFKDLIVKAIPIGLVFAVLSSIVLNFIF